MNNSSVNFSYFSDLDEYQGQGQEFSKTRVNELISQEKWSEAYNYLESISSVNAHDHLIPIKLGHLAFKLSNYALAEIWYFLSLQNEKNLDEIWFGLGQVYFAQKSYNKAISAFSTLMHISPRFLYASLSYLKLGISCLKVKEFQNALNYLEQSLTKGDLNKELMAQGYCYMGIANLALRRNENGFKFIEKAAGFIRNFLTSICLGWKLLLTEPLKVLLLVKTMLKQSQKIGEISDFLFIRALAYNKLRKLKKAKKSLALLVRKFPSNLIYGQYLAIVQVRRGKLDKAFGILERLRIIWPFHLALLLNYKKILVKMGRLLEAETVKMQICGILMIHQYDELEIFRTINGSSEDLDEPEFLLSDCPLTECQDYTLIQ